MKIFIETDRYIVREMMESDAPGMLALDSDSRVHEYLGNKTIQSEEQALSAIQKVIKQYEQNGIGRWAIEWKANGDFVGWTGLKLESAFGPIKNFYDLGYRLRPEYWGKVRPYICMNSCVTFCVTYIQCKCICIGFNDFNRSIEVRICRSWVADLSI